MFTKAKMVGWAVLATAVAILCLLYWNAKKDNKALTKTTIEQSVELGVAKVDTVKKEESAKITDTVVSTVIQQGRADKSAQTKIDDFVTKKVAEINEKYDELEKTAASDKERDEEVSRIRITGLWHAYCEVQVADAQCKK